MAVSSPPETSTGTRLGTALLIYMLAVTLIINLLPFHFTWPDEFQLTFGADPYDLVADFMLFVPLGFLYRMATPRGWAAVVLIVVNAAVISLAIEAMQLLDETRQAAVLDIVANSFGALVGVLAFDRIARLAELKGRVIGWLGLEIPLMSLVYLLLPLLVVNSMGARGDFAPLAGTFVIGVFGALLMGGLQRHYFGPGGTAEPHLTALFAAGWFLGGTLALFPWRPFEIVVGTLLVAGICWWKGRRNVIAEGANRRFEVPLLRSALPVYAAYMLVLLVAPLLEEVYEWHGFFGFPHMAPSQVEIARLLELIAAFTLVGYMAVELRGRELADFRAALPRLVLWGVGLAIAIEVARGFSVHGASLARGVLLAAACLFGGALYLLQRAHVRWVVSQPIGMKRT